MQKINLRNKKQLYIFLGICFIVIIIGVILIPVPNNQTFSKQALNNAAVQISSNQPYNYNPIKVDIGNFSLPTASVKLYQYTNNEQDIVNQIVKNIPNLTVEKPQGQILTTMANSNYYITYDSEKKIVLFENRETQSSNFDGYDKNNALEKASKIFGFRTGDFEVFSSTQEKTGELNIGFKQKIDGINLEFGNDIRTTIDMSIKNGKLIYMQWTVASVDKGQSVSLMDQAYLKQNFGTLPKNYYSDRSLTKVDPNSANPQAIPFDTSDFNGNIEITGGTLVYFSQNITSNYILPTYKLSAKYTQGDKVMNGYVYVPAYKI